MANFEKNFTHYFGPHFIKHELFISEVCKMEIVSTSLCNRRLLGYFMGKNVQRIGTFPKCQMKIVVLSRERPEIENSRSFGQ